jgi:hypothetical protein
MATIFDDDVEEGPDFFYLSEDERENFIGTLKAMSTIEVIDLVDCEAFHTVREISMVLHLHVSLRDLCVDVRDTSDNETALFLAALKKNTSLRTLRVHGEWVAAGDRFLSELIVHFMKSQSLMKLELTNWHTEENDQSTREDCDESEARLVLKRECCDAKKVKLFGNLVFPKDNDGLPLRGHSSH